MKSTIRVDFNAKEKPVIKIESSTDVSDLRDKALFLFLTELGAGRGGRLCFIDSSGSKESHSFSAEPPKHTSFTITPINTNDYELLLKEIEILIQYRNKTYETSSPKERKEYLSKIDDFEFKQRMNY